MGETVLRAIREQVKKEDFARKMGFRLLNVQPGYALVEMPPREDTSNIFGMTHGGAIFSLIDEAFQVSCNAHGTIAVALNMTVTYHRAPEKNSLLRAESREIHRARKTATYEIRVTDEKDSLIASCMALAYRKKEKLPFLHQ
ncbi:MAG: PaaI family thioesterase [Deltaproteobacteria bacterium]|nr:PaaI family thioesterase [Deltaproteobacteria bacterium]MBW1919669.1 PaaI family thioesterase [Deltaproteobacteria bacterium]MBW1936207.1 PaaI family thioesterase [Deltaproteobacteria bacterium]MBW1978049.1 PaaI family thioesterase [Deltaproteobacteria bacterium]MBW2045307.1 PaaI family thioesterase [Deltaproteobacteria bacterium]